ncbi:MAG: rRNA maturation RNase YbeY [Spirochaetales bacterium]|nr:rRNA maturation RNase YbeY [Spirochaetales bacterium]
MNEITLMYQNIAEVEWEDNFLDFIDSILDELKLNNWEMSVTLCNNDYIHSINKEYRHIDKPTDVISFVMSDEPMPLEQDEDDLYSAGDIVISLEYVKENSEYFKVSEVEELKRVTIHGILHLMGMDHKTNNDDELMLIEQERILELFKDEEIY